MHKQGDRIEVKSKAKTFSGVFIKEEKDFLVIKLGNGYNVGIAKKNITEEKLLEPAKSEERVHDRGTALDSTIPTISILHTGGTIASKVDYETGAVLARFTPEEILELFPELEGMANIRSKLIGNLLSENMRFHQYNLMAEAIADELKHKTEGIIITHGTDTLHYSAAALSFMLENINIPVVFVGSQRSSDRPSSDSSANLISAAIFIINARQPGVYVCMHENLNDETCIIIEGVNARKMHSSRRDAFRPVNKGLAAIVDYTRKTVKIIKEAKEKEGDGALKITPFKEGAKIGILKAHPNMLADELVAYKHFDALLIEGTGLGHIGIEDGKGAHANLDFKHELSLLAKKIPIAMSAQTVYGRVNMNVYSTGRELLEMGICGNLSDMTPETAFIKLAWLISHHTPERTRELFGKNLRGEISERSEKEYFLN